MIGHVICIREQMVFDQDIEDVLYTDNWFCAITYCNTEILNVHHFSHFFRL